MRASGGHNSRVIEVIEGTSAFYEMEDPRGTGDRLKRVERSALDLVEVIEDLVRDMDMIALNLSDATKRTHEFGQARRARELGRAIRDAVADGHHVGRLAPLAPRRPVFGGERRRQDRRMQVGSPVAMERRYRIRRRQSQP
jgi:hypothetical protein